MTASPRLAVSSLGPAPLGARFQPPMRVTAAAARRDKPSLTRNLVLAYWTGWQSFADLTAIAAHVSEMDPGIATFIVPATQRGRITAREIATRPTLVVSPGMLARFEPSRGRVYQGKMIPKIEELRRLGEAGVRVPRTAILTPDFRPDPAVWGEVVVVKPTDIPSSSHGRAIRLMRTRDVRFLAPTDYPDGHPGRRGPMMVQQFIDTGERVGFCRVLTWFGEPLYALREESRTPRPPLVTDEDIATAVIAIQAIADTAHTFTEDRDLLTLARAAHDAIPEIPLMGCDILRDVATGKLYVIELNCGGNTWHFSSQYLAATRAENGAEFELRRRQQFDALRTAARVLVERTRAEAA